MTHTKKIKGIVNLFTYSGFQNVAVFLVFLDLTRL